MLKINGAKTKIMLINNKSMSPINIGDQTLDEVQLSHGKCDSCGQWERGRCEVKNKESIISGKPKTSHSIPSSKSSTPMSNPYCCMDQKPGGTQITSPIN